MKFYAHEGNMPLGEERLGTDSRMLIDLKTSAGAIKRACAVYGSKAFSLYSYTNFYDDKTFTRIVQWPGNPVSDKEE